MPEVSSDRLDPMVRVEAALEVVHATVAALQVESEYQRGRLWAVMLVLRSIALKLGIPEAVTHDMIEQAVKAEQQRAAAENHAYISDVLDAEIHVRAK